MHRVSENEMKKLSYWKEDSSEPLKNITVGQLIKQAAEKYPDKVAILAHRGAKLTYGQVLDKVDSLASALINLGLKRGDHVALWGFNTIEWYLSFLAALRAGFVVVNLNPLYQSAELLTCLKRAEVKALIMDEKLGDHNFYDIFKNVVPEIEENDFNVHIISKVVPLLETVIVMSKQSFKGTFNWHDLIMSTTEDEKLKIEDIQMKFSTFDVCNMQFTSGTTSDPKCVQLTHHSLINAACISAKRKTFYEKPHRICNQLPFFHAYGAVHSILALIGSGCLLILPSVKFSPNKSVDCIIEEKCSVVYGTPTMFSDLLAVIRARIPVDEKLCEKMSSVEFFLCGGAVCLPEIVREIKKYFVNSQFLYGWGMTETSATGFSTAAGDPYDIASPSVGRVTDHVEVKVIDDNGLLVPLGVAGELCCRGYNIMKGYYKDDAKTAEVLDNDGWIRTGDKCILMENGYGDIVDRIKDIIIRGGENIAPKEIEQLLIKHSDIIDVQVYGVKDIRLGEAVAAAVIKVSNSDLNGQDIKNYCNGKIASYKIPQHIVFLDKFPKTASGKIQKVKLREMTENQYSLERK